MKKFAVKLGACALSVCMISVVFAGCGEEQTNPPQVTEAEATSVQYSESGEYTTTVTLDGADFSELGTDDVQVAYSLFDEAKYNAAISAASDKSKIKRDDYEKSTAAQVKSVTANGSSMTVSFTDSDAAKNRTDYYALYIESRQIGASVEVEFEDFNLTTKTEYVLASDETIPLTLTLDDGQFAQTVDEADITLSGGFEGLTIANIVSSGTNLTMQLTGEIKKHESSNAYLDGTVTIAAKAIKDAGEDERIIIPVRTKSAYLVGDQLKFEGGKGVLPLFLIDCGVDTSTLVKGDISFYKKNETGGETSADVTVDSVDCKSKTEVLLTLNVPGATNKNDVAKALYNVTVKVKDSVEFASNVTTAVFYPVFDYVEDAGQKQNITLELYAYNGTFAETLTKETFGLNDDFKDGQVTSVTRTSDTVAELGISVPANGQTVDDLDKTGSVIAKAGALVNEWGEACDADFEYTRRYTQDSLGRDLSAGDIDTIKGIVGGFGNTALGTITGVASGAVTGINAVMTILDLTGIVPNKTSQTLDLLKSVASNVQTILTLMNRQIQMLRELQQDEYKSQLSDFDAELSTLNDQNDKMATYYEHAKTDLGINPDDKDHPYPTAEQQKDPTEMKKLAKSIKTYCEEQEAAHNNKYEGFTANFRDLVTAYGNVAAKAMLPGDENPMGVFDKLCAMTYNFDVSTYAARTAQRLEIEYALKEGFLNIALYYGCEFDDQEINPDLKSAKTHFVAFESLINTDTKNGKKQGDFAVVRRNVVTEDVDILMDQYVYSYVLNLNLVKNLQGDYDTTSAINTTPTPDDKKSGTNFSDDQRTEFVKRMQGRTMQEELILAGYGHTTIDLYRNVQWSVGVAFKCYTERDGAYSFWDVRNFRHWYADIIKWDETQITEKVKTHYEWEDQDYDLVDLWHTSWVPN